MLILTFVDVVVIVIVVVGLNFCNEKIFILLLYWSIIAIDVMVTVIIIVVDLIGMVV